MLGPIAAAAASSRFGAVGRLARVLALRLIRPYSANEDGFDDAVATAITEISQRTRPPDRSVGGARTAAGTGRLAQEATTGIEPVYTALQAAA